MTESCMYLPDIKSSPSLTGRNNNRKTSSIRLNLSTKTTWKLKTPGGFGPHRFAVNISVVVNLAKGKSNLMRLLSTWNIFTFIYPNLPLLFSMNGNNSSCLANLNSYLHQEYTLRKGERLINIRSPNQVDSKLVLIVTPRQRLRSRSLH